MTTQSVLTIVIIIIIILVIIWAISGSNKEHHDDFHGNGGGSTIHGGGGQRHGGGGCGHGGGCCCNDTPCDPPQNVRCKSKKPFEVQVKWDAPDNCDIDHYNVYIKFLKECGNESGSHGRGRRRRGRRPVRGCKERDHKNDCGCDPCDKRRKKYPCGKHKHDKVIVVPANKTNIVLHPIKKKGVCIAVSAVSKCGKESPTCRPCKTCVNCRVVAEPCIQESDCKGLTLKWKKVECATAFKIYYNDDLLFELPGDATGASGLPPVEQGDVYGCEQGECEQPVITVSVCTECGEGPRVPVEDCDDCIRKKKHRCKRDHCRNDKCGKKHHHHGKCKERHHHEERCSEHGSRGKCPCQGSKSSGSHDHSRKQSHARRARAVQGRRIRTPVRASRNMTRTPHYVRSRVSAYTPLFSNF